MELIRLILLEIEKEPTGRYPEEFNLSGHDARAVGYHLRLLHEAGLIVGIDASSSDEEDIDIMPERLTWAGHEFIDAAREPERWSKTMQKVKEIGGSTTLNIVTAMLTQFMLKSTGLAP